MRASSARIVRMYLHRGVISIPNNFSTVCAEAFINTDDPTPATAAVLRHARTMDVTNDPGRKRFTGGGHRWPVQYYINRLTDRV